jgi:hypothetical protein
MEKKQDYHKDTRHHTEKSFTKDPREQKEFRNQREQFPRENREPNREQNREPNQGYKKNFNRDNYQKNNFQKREESREGGQPFQRDNQRQSNSYAQRSQRIKAEETVEDIVNDIVRIEKEIDLEMKEIKNLRL